MTPRTDAPGAGRASGRPPHAWHLVLGLGLWLAWFGATYGGVAVACAVAPPPPAQGPFNWINAVVLLLAAACTAGFGVAARLGARAARRAPAGAAGARDRFVARCATVLYATAAISTAAVALPAVLLAPCG